VEDYRLTNPGITVGEFLAVWDSVDKGTRKVSLLLTSFSWFYFFNSQPLQTYEKISKAKKTVNALQNAATRAPEGGPDPVTDT